MAERNISNSALRTALINGDPFEYAHLVKFERPFASKNGDFRTNANRYVYLTDGQRDITFDGNTYKASGLVTVGSYSETTQAKATNMSLTLPGEFLGTEVVVTASFGTDGKITATNQLGSDVNDTIDFFEEGFREGDKIRVVKNNGTNFSDGDNQKDLIITGFESDNKVLVLAVTGTDSDDSAFLSSALSSAQLKISLINEEYRGATMEKGTTSESTVTADNTATITLASANSQIERGQLVSGPGILDETIVKSVNGTTLTLDRAQPRVPAGAKLVFTNPSFVNREVFVHKAYINPETGATYGDPILTFKGIIASTNIQESPTSSKVQWNLTSHWGDFQEVRGRLTKDEIHRALDANGLPNKNLTVRPEYASDLGFLHAETSLNTIATYQTTETRYKIKSKKRGGLAGLIGMKKYYQEEYQVQVDNEVDLSVYLQGSYLPVVYGVHRINGIPVFADTKNDNSKEVYVVYALAEGKVHGLYNAFIDGSPLICTDKADFDVRNASNGTDGENTQLQCYGRADIGNTLSGNIVQSNTETEIDYDNEDLFYTDAQGNNTRQNSASVNDSREGKYNAVDESNIPTLTAGDATGLRHKETFSISHPYSMFFTFYQGKDNQVGDNNLTTIAQAGNFKRQAEYYSGEKLYWSPNHKLLDTAYVVMKFTIDADQTTIPDVEYVIKGKVLECFNYDGTFVPDPVYSTANGDGSNFKEGDSVTVEVSANGTSWSSDGGGTYRILDKYLFTPAEGSSYLRFRLDRNPVVGTNQYIRLNDGSSNYWSMITYDQAVIKESDNVSFPVADQVIATNALSTNGNGVLNATLTNAQETKLTTLYPDLASSTTKRESLQITGGTGIFANLRKKVNRAKYNASTNLLVFVDAQFSANQNSNAGQPLNGASIVSGTNFDFSNVSALASLSSNARVVGAKLKVIETGEERTISGFDTSTNILTIDTPFIEYPTSSMKITISGAGKDERASINPAIQLTDMLINDRFGKALDLENDIDLPSIKESALLCDTRSDITVPLGSTASCVAGDIYKLVDGSGNHVASGKVKTSTSSTSSVVLTDVSGKFTRGYQNYITYRVGDIVYNLIGGTTRYYRVTTAGTKATAPIHVSGTTNGFEYISSVSLSKVSGSGPSSLSLALDGRTIEYSLYDSDYVKYWRYLGWEENRQYAVTRHQTNFIFATERPIFENINALLSHFNGQLSYSNGKYSLSVETGESAPTSSISDGIQQNPEFITDDDIIGTISLNDNAQKNAKNTIKASIIDPQNNFQTRSVSFFNSDFLKADRGKIKTGNYPVTGITSYYNARIGVEKELIQTRYSKEVSFTIGPKGLLLKPGEVIGLTYKPFGFENKLFRIQNLNYQSNCTTSVKATEYNDNIYAITPQVASNAQRAATGGNFGLEAPGAPTNLTSGTAKPGIITLNWTNATDYKETIDSTEIWRATTQGSSGDITSHATLLTVVDNATTFNDAVGIAGTYYYWIRHRRVSRRTSDNSTVKLVSPFESNINAGVVGVANVLSPQLDVDISSFQVKFNASNALTPGGASQDATFTATLRNITASNVTFTLVDADGSTTATDGVVFTNSSASVVDSSAPFTATLDASSFSHNTPNKFVKVTATDSGTSESFTELIPVTVTKDGSSGSLGQDAKAIKLTPSSHVVSYTATGGESTTVSFTTATQGTSGFSGTPNYKFLVGGVQKQSGTTSTFTLAQSDEPAAEATVNVTVQLFDGTPSGSPEATDTVTIFGVKSGADSITAFLTNNSHTVSSNSDGTLASGALDDAGGTFKVFVGTTDRTTSCTFSEVAGQETSGLTSNINSSTGVYEVTGLTVDNAVNIFRASIPSNISPTGSAVTLDQTYSISKSRTGTPGSAGSNAKTVRLTSTGYSVAYDGSGSSPDPSGTFTLTATATNFTDPYFKFTGDGITDETSYTDGSGASDTKSFSVPSSFFSTPKVLRVGVSEAADSTTEIAFDSIAIVAVKDGGEGADAFTAVLTNEAHTFPADNDGTVTSFNNSGTDIQVFKGATELNGIVSGTPSTGQFKVTATASNISTGSISSSGNPVVVGNHSNMTADTATISYSINVENSITLIKKQTFTKSKKGDAGTNTATVKIYKKQATLLPIPAHPDNTTVYTFSSGAWPGSGNQNDGWSTDRNAGTGAVTYSCQAQAIGPNGATTATIQVADWSDPVIETADIGRSRFIRAYYDNWTENTTLPTLVTTYDDDANGTNDTGLRYDFDNETLILGSLNSGWTTSALGDGNLPYALAFVNIIETAGAGGTQSITAQIRGVGTWSRLPPGGIRLVSDDSNRTVRFAGDNTSNLLGPTLDITKLYNDQISLSDSGALTRQGGASAGSVSLGGLGGITPAAAQTKVDNRLSDTEKTRLNAGKSPDDSKFFNNAEVDAAHVGLGQVTNESKATMFANPTFTGTVAGVTKAHVGLPNTADGATVGAKLDDNLVDENNNDLTSSDIVTNQGTSSDTSNVNSIAAANVTGGVTQVNTNLGNFQDSLEDGTGTVNASAISIGSLNTDRINLQELFLPTTGTTASGVTHSITSSGHNTTRFIFDAGTGAGYYVGHISFDNNVRTIRGGDFDADGPILFLQAGGVTLFQTSMFATHAYERSSGQATTEGAYHMPFAFFYTGTGTVKVNIRLETTSGTESLAIKGRAVKFGAELASFDTSSFTASRTVSAASGNSDSGTVTVSTAGSGSSSVSLSGNSNALVSVNGGTFTASPGNISNNQTFEIRIPASNSNGVTRSATVTIDGISATYSVTTTGTYSSGGYGSGGGGTGGIATEQQLR